MRISGRPRLAPSATTVEITVDRPVLTLTPRLTSLEMPVEASVPWLSMLLVPVLMTAIWLEAVEAPVETTVAMLVPEDTAVDSEVIADLTVDMPTVAVDSEPENSSQVLFSVETCAEVEPVVVLLWAVLSSVPIEVTLESSVDSEVVPDKTTLAAVEIELAT